MHMTHADKDMPSRSTAIVVAVCRGLSRWEVTMCRWSINKIRRVGCAPENQPKFRAEIIKDKHCPLVLDAPAYCSSAACMATQSVCWTQAVSSSSVAEAHAWRVVNVIRRNKHILAPTLDDATPHHPLSPGVASSADPCTPTHQT